MNVAIVANVASSNSQYPIGNIGNWYWQHFHNLTSGALAKEVGNISTISAPLRLCAKIKKDHEKKSGNIPFPKGGSRAA